MRIDKNTILNISSGMIVWFIIQFFKDIVYNIIDEKEDVFVLNANLNYYIAAIVTGFVSGLFINRLSTFNTVFLTLAIYYGVYRSLNDLENIENVNEQEFIEKFIRDLLFIYLIRLIYIELLKNKIDKKDNRNTNTLDYKISSGLLASIPIGIYLAFSAYYNDKIRESKNK